MFWEFYSIIHFLATIESIIAAMVVVLQAISRIMHVVKIIDLHRCGYCFFLTQFQEDSSSTRSWRNLGRRLRNRPKDRAKSKPQSKCQCSRQ
jgi:hypothetical protein